MYMYVNSSIQKYKFVYRNYSGGPTYIKWTLLRNL